ncbi:hypothetical protein [Dactylosporangium sp. NPDC049140]|uniref:hypothetical protein n=1 Tax=Dactylosporangium sp. NPDC049140 TaxID=3155647 RepID=UPI0033F914E6
MLDGFLVHRLGTPARDGPADALRLAVRRVRTWLYGERRQVPVADVWFLLLTIAAFVVLGLAVRAVERL